MTRESAKSTLFPLYHLYLVGKNGIQQKALSDTRFVLFGSGRSGSSALVNLLNQLPAVSCEGEILFSRVRYPYQHIKAKCAQAETPGYGFKLLTYQLSDVQKIASPQEFLERLHADHFRFIYLKRKNLLMHALSNIRARKLGFHKDKGEAGFENQKINVAPKTLSVWLESITANHVHEGQWLSRIPHLALVYETDLQYRGQHSITVAKVCDFLQIDADVSQIECGLRKISPLTLEASVENCEEVTQWLATSKFAYLLEYANE